MSLIKKKKKISLISEGTVAFFNLATAASAALGSIAQWLQSNLLHPGIPIRDTLTPQLITFSPSLPACSSAPSAVTIVLAVIGSVVLIGIILLALWKLLVTIHDRREFDRFQSERSRARYEMVSLGWGCCWCMGGLLGCTGSKQLCSEGEGWQARGMQVSMPCGAFRVQHAALPSPWQVINALQNYTQPLAPLSISQQSWRLEEVGETVVAAKLVRSVREPFWEALGGGAQCLRAVPLPAGRMEGGSNG